MISVGVDGSPASSAAARWAAREAQRRDLPLRLVHVADRRGTAPAGPIDGCPPPRRIARVPRQVADELRFAHPDLSVSSVVIFGSPAAVLDLTAEQSDMLVLGSRGNGAVPRLLAGSVALATLHRTARPVVLVRADDHWPHGEGLPSTPASLGQVVVGLEVSRPSDDLLRFAFDAAAHRAGVLRVVHGWTTYVPDGAPGASSVDPLPALADNEALSSALDPWRAKYPDVEVEAEAVVGRPAEHLVDAARGADLVVVGRSTRRPLGISHIGQVTRAVLHHAPAPVAVVAHE
ncbi:universal stress protein [Streptomyces buecherae]|uniref:Universal stress protein n=1 Tax=Streptomyces buecherae TaxID=2763006 RepID=A0A7H8NIE7_9ACTN|nr:universal stress protein [Streptomyces buecherae]QKW54190.1 universal stress protein [Streptomyces buecherae]